MASLKKTKLLKLKFLSLQVKIFSINIYR